MSPRRRRRLGPQGLCSNCALKKTWPRDCVGADLFASRACDWKVGSLRRIVCSLELCAWPSRAARQRRFVPTLAPSECETHRLCRALRAIAMHRVDLNGGPGAKPPALFFEVGTMRDRRSSLRYVDPARSQHQRTRSEKVRVISSLTFWGLFS